MALLLATLLLGFVAGLRAMTAPAIASLAIACGWIGPAHGWTTFMGYRWTAWILAVAALAEWITDQMPSTPSRKVPAQFFTRIVMGGLAGATLGATGDHLLAGFLLGAVGAFSGTLLGATCRASLARGFRADRPAAFVEDAVAVAIGLVAIGLI